MLYNFSVFPVCVRMNSSSRHAALHLRCKESSKASHPKTLSTSPVAASHTWWLLQCTPLKASTRTGYTANSISWQALTPAATAAKGSALIRMCRCFASKELALHEQAVLTQAPPSTMLLLQMD